MLKTRRFGRGMDARLGSEATKPVPAGGARKFPHSRREETRPRGRRRVRGGRRGAQLFAIGISRCLAGVGDDFGKVIRSTPFSKRAATLSTATFSGSVKARLKEP